MDYLYKSNDNVVELNGVQNNVTSAYVNSSTNVTAKLQTLDGTELVAARTLTYIAASDGNYRDTWDTAVISSVAEGVHYLVYVVAEGGLDLTIKHIVTVRERMV